MSLPNRARAARQTCSLLSPWPPATAAITRSFSSTPSRRGADEDGAVPSTNRVGTGAGGAASASSTGTVGEASLGDGAEVRGRGRGRELRRRPPVPPGRTFSPPRTSGVPGGAASAASRGAGRGDARPRRRLPASPREGSSERGTALEPGPLGAAAEGLIFADLSGAGAPQGRSRRSRFPLPPRGAPAHRAALGDDAQAREASPHNGVGVLGQLGEAEAARAPSGGEGPWEDQPRGSAEPPEPTRPGGQQGSPIHVAGPFEASEELARKAMQHDPVARPERRAAGDALAAARESALGPGDPGAGPGAGGADEGGDRPGEALREWRAREKAGGMAGPHGRKSSRALRAVEDLVSVLGRPAAGLAPAAGWDWGGAASHAMRGNAPPPPQPAGHVETDLAPDSPAVPVSPSIRGSWSQLDALQQVFGVLDGTLSRKSRGSAGGTSGAGPGPLPLPALSALPLESQLEMAFATCRLILAGSPSADVLGSVLRRLAWTERHLATQEGRALGYADRLRSGGSASGPGGGRATRDDPASPATAGDALAPAPPPAAWPRPLHEARELSALASAAMARECDALAARGQYPPKLASLAAAWRAAGGRPEGEAPAGAGEQAEGREPRRGAGEEGELAAEGGELRQGRGEAGELSRQGFGRAPVPARPDAHPPWWPMPPAEVASLARATEASLRLLQSEAVQAESSAPAAWEVRLTATAEAGAAPDSAPAPGAVAASGASSTSGASEGVPGVTGEQPPPLALFRSPSHHLPVLMGLSRHRRAPDVPEAFRETLRSLLGVPTAALSPRDVTRVLGSVEAARERLDPAVADHLALATLRAMATTDIGPDQVGSVAFFFGLQRTSPLDGLLCRAACASIWRHLDALDAPKLASFLVALAWSGHRPGLPFLEASWAALSDLRTKGRTDPTSVARALWAWTRLNFVSDDATRAMARALARGAVEGAPDAAATSAPPAPPNSLLPETGGAAVPGHLSRSGGPGGWLAGQPGASATPPTPRSSTSVDVEGRAAFLAALGDGRLADRLMAASRAPLAPGDLISDAWRAGVLAEPLREFLRRTAERREAVAEHRLEPGVLRAVRAVLATVRGKALTPPPAPAGWAPGGQQPAGQQWHRHGAQTRGGGSTGAWGAPGAPQAPPPEPATRALETSEYALLNAIERPREPGELPPAVDEVRLLRGVPVRIRADPLTGLVTAEPEYSRTSLLWNADVEGRLRAPGLTRVRVPGAGEGHGGAASPPASGGKEPRSPPGSVPADALLALAVLDAIDPRAAARARARDARLEREAEARATVEAAAADGDALAASGEELALALAADEEGRLDSDSGIDDDSESDDDSEGEADAGAADGSDAEVGVADGSDAEGDTADGPLPAPGAASSATGDGAAGDGAAPAGEADDGSAATQPRDRTSPDVPLGGRRGRTGRISDAGRAQSWQSGQAEHESGRREGGGGGRPRPRAGAPRAPLPTADPLDALARARGAQAAAEQVVSEGGLLSVPLDAWRRWLSGPRLELSELADAIAGDMARLPWHHFTAALWAMAAQREPHERLFREATVGVLRRWQSTTPQVLSAYLYSCGSLQVKVPREVTERAVDRMCRLVARQPAAQRELAVTNLVWSLTALGTLEEAEFARAMELMPRDAPGWEAVAFQGRARVFQAALHLGFRLGCGPEALLPPPARGPCARAWRTRDATVSQYHMEVLAVLESLGVPCEVEHVPPHGLFSIDVAVRPTRGRPLAVEVDGPRHFSQSAPHRPLAHTVLRDQLLRHYGWDVVSVPWAAWSEMDTDARKRAFLRKAVVERLRRAERGA